MIHLRNSQNLFINYSENFKMQFNITTDLDNLKQKAVELHGIV